MDVSASAVSCGDNSNCKYSLSQLYEIFIMVRLNQNDQTMLFCLKLRPKLQKNDDITQSTAIFPFPSR
jgi:hypothetical protein